MYNPHFERKILIILELTIPYESNVNSKHTYKFNKYSFLQRELGADWTVFNHPWEVSARGYASLSTQSMLYKLGLCKKQMKSVMSQLSYCALSSSFRIYLSRYHKTWVNDSTQ